MSEPTQTVVDETKATAQPVVAADSARTQGDDLESLLAQYEERTKPADPPAPVAAPAKTEEDVASRLQAMEGVVQQFTQQKFKDDMKSVVETVRGELPSEVFDDTLIEGWVNAMAMKDDRLSKAWMNRDANPQGFKKIMGELGKEFNKKFSKLPDAAATDDRAIVAAAVRGSSTKAPENPPPNFSGMNNAEYRNKVRSEFGFDPGV